MVNGLPVMFSLEELLNNVAAYQSGRMSLRDFRNWFEDHSSVAYDMADLRDACVAIDAVFSEYYYDNIGEVALKGRLATAMVPFSLRALERDPYVLAAEPVYSDQVRPPAPALRSR